MTDFHAQRTLAPDAFFAGVLAGLTSIGQTALTGSRSDLHRAFYAAVGKCGKSLGLETAEVDFDPLYGVSPWFDRALTRAQRDLLVNFPNPTYERIEICFEKDEANEVLRETGYPDQFVEFAKALAAGLPSSQ